MKTILASLSFMISTPLLALNISVESPALKALIESYVPDAKVHLILEQGQSPHHFQMRPTQIEEVKASDFLIFSGATSAPEIAKAANLLSAETVLDLSALVEDFDVHFWVSQVETEKVIRAIAARIEGDVEAPLALNTTALPDTKITEVSAIVGHDIFGALERDHALTFEGAFADEHDHDAGAKTHVEHNHSLEHGEVACVILDKNEPQPDLEKLAKTHNIAVHELDFLGFEFLDAEDGFFTTYRAAMWDIFAQCAHHH